MPRKRKVNQIKYRVPAVERALAILEMFASKNRGYTITEVSRSLKLPISTTSSLLYTLLHCGYLRRDEDGDFHLTMRLLSEASQLLNQIELRDIARPWLRKLVISTGLSAVLAIRDGDRLVWVDKLDGRGDVKLTAQVGMRLYMHAPATGKVLLAYLSDEEVQNIIDSAGLPALTENTITTLPALKRELEKVRAQGYSMDDREAAIGLRGVAAPIFDHDSRVIAAICAAGAVFDLSENVRAVAAEVKQAAMQISERLGYSDAVAFKKVRA